MIRTYKITSTPQSALPEVLEVLEAKEQGRPWEDFEVEWDPVEGACFASEQLENVLVEVLVTEYHVCSMNTEWAVFARNGKVQRVNRPAWRPQPPFNLFSRVRIDRKGNVSKSSI